MERQPIPKIELSEQYLADLAYFNFIRLAQIYGKKPKIDNDNPEPEEYQQILQNMKTLTVNIPMGSSPEQFYFLSGKDWGPGSNTVEIYYQKGDMSTKLKLVKSKKSGNVQVVQESFFYFDTKSKVLTPISNRKAKVNMSEVNNCLKNAESALENQEKARIIAREAAFKIPFKQILYDGMVSLAQMLPPSI